MKKCKHEWIVTEWDYIYGEEGKSSILDKKIAKKLYCPKCEWIQHLERTL